MQEKIASKERDIPIIFPFQDIVISSYLVNSMDIWAALAMNEVSALSGNNWELRKLTREFQRLFGGRRGEAKFAEEERSLRGETTVS